MMASKKKKISLLLSPPRPPNQSPKQNRNLWMKTLPRWKKKPSPQPLDPMAGDPKLHV
jgi:hypothetical protein